MARTPVTVIRASSSLPEKRYPVRKIIPRQIDIKPIAAKTKKIAKKKLAKVKPQLQQNSLKAQKSTQKQVVKKPQRKPIPQKKGKDQTSQKKQILNSKSKSLSKANEKMIPEKKDKNQKLKAKIKNQQNLAKEATRRSSRQKINPENKAAVPKRQARPPVKKPAKQQKNQELSVPKQKTKIQRQTSSKKAKKVSQKKNHKKKAESPGEETVVLPSPVKQSAPVKVQENQAQKAVLPASPQKNNDKVGRLKKGIVKQQENIDDAEKAVLANFYHKRMKTLNELMEIKMKRAKRSIIITKIEHNVEEWVFHLLVGKTMKHVVRLSNGIKCSCIEFRASHTQCRHIQFVVSKVAERQNLLADLTVKKDLENILKELSEALFKRLEARICQGTDVEKLTKGPDCLICFTKISEEDGDLFPCDGCEFKFHDSCIQQWQNFQMGCPVCKKQLKKIPADNLLTKLQDFQT